MKLFWLSLIAILLILAIYLNLAFFTFASEPVKVSWYAKGLKSPESYTAACWGEYPKGTLFKVSYKQNSVIVRCNDRGHFKEMGRYLDLSSGAFKQLAPLSRGLLWVNVEVVK